MVTNKIQVLSQETIDKIAAGEVVERPSSVAKELVENAIDAGATAITVEIKDGGCTLIRITDNGSGIRKDQVPLAFLRHSTSKITSASDLAGVTSLGFRGEALSSIAAVAHVELITKPMDQMLGVSYVIEGGREISMEEVGAPDGSTFFVRQLFYNTPARKKFLKSNHTEGTYVLELMQHMALSHPEIAFRFISQGQEKLTTSGSGSLKDVIYQVFGREIAANVLDVALDSEDFSIKGFIGTSAVARGNRNFEHFFIGGRYVKSALLSRSLEDGYHGFLMQHQYPFCALHLNFVPGGIDVNVHPTKQEVRIEDGPAVAEALCLLVSHRLSRREDIAQVEISEPSESVPTPAAVDVQVSGNPEKPQKGPEPFEASRLQALKEEIAASVHKASPYEPQYREFYQKKSADGKGPVMVREPEVAPAPAYVQEELFLSTESAKNHRIIGQVFGTYWLVEFDQKLYIIDQHAAHEKVLYERTMNLLKDKEMTSQMVSPPIVVTLSAQEEETLENCSDALEEMGFELSEFGGREYAICGVPGNLFSLDPKQLFLDVLAECSGIKTRGSYETIMERVASMSCKAAVKGNQQLSRPEIEELITELLSLDNPYHCPHGRPTIISMTRQELEKKFKRIV